MRLGITQRVEVVSSYGETRDCLDQNWHRFLAHINVEVIVIPNVLKNPQKFFQALNIEGFVISGGNDISSLPNAQNASLDRDQTEFSILNYCETNKLPVIGVCRGMQIMGAFFNEKMVQVDGHVAKRHNVTSIHSNLFPTQEVNSFHNWGFKTLAQNSPLIAQVHTSDKSIEAWTHKTLPWCGIMWHPEREDSFSESDINLFKYYFP